jgi:rhamnosyltransferase
MIAAVTVLYNPDQSVLNNISSYIDYVDILYAVDNSDRQHSSIVKILLENPKIQYINNNGNQGIAHALNIGAYKAIDMNYTWLLTMDQDSSFAQTMLTQYFTCWNSHLNKDDTAIFSPVHSLPDCHIPSTVECETVNKFHVMTSGNIINLNIFKDLKGFNEALFIDEVDREYCLRSKLAGYSIIEFSNISLKHNLGEPISIVRQGQTIQLSTHTPKRFYYIARNLLYVWKTYHHLFPNLAGIQFVNIMKTLIFPLIYHDKKMQRFFYIMLGIFHFSTGRYGK